MKLTSTSSRHLSHRVPKLPLVMTAIPFPPIMQHGHRYPSCNPPNLPVSGHMDYFQSNGVAHVMREILARFLRENVHALSCSGVPVMGLRQGQLRWRLASIHNSCDAPVPRPRIG